MRLVNDLVVRGKPPEIDKLVERLENDVQDTLWKREPEVETSLREWGIGRLGVYCFSRREGLNLPVASCYICKTAANQLSSSSVIPSKRQPLTDEAYNAILADFTTRILSSLAEGIGVTIEIVPPRLSRLEWSISPESLRKLIHFAGMIQDRNHLTMEDRANWDAFLEQVHSDRSLLEAKDLGSWLVSEGWSHDQAHRIVSRMDVEPMFEPQGFGL